VANPKGSADDLSDLSLDPKRWLALAVIALIMHFVRAASGTRTVV
jgi:hypothetical protein